MARLMAAETPSVPWVDCSTPATGQHVGAPAAVHRCRGREPSRGRPQDVGGDAAHRLGALGPPPAHRRAHGIPARGARGDVVVVDEPLVDEHVGQGEQHDEVGARHRGEVDAGAVVGEPGRRRRPRVDHDQTAARPGPGEVLDEWRHRRGGVRPDDEHGVRAPEVGEREGEAAVDPQGAVGPGGGRRHAEPAVVVDVRRAQHDPSELAQACRPSRWSARPRRTPRPRRGRALPGWRPGASARGRAPRPRSPARAARGGRRHRPAARAAWSGGRSR